MQEKSDSKSAPGWTWWSSWRPTSAHHLKNVETKVLDCVKSDLWARFVSLPTQDKIWTLSVTHKSLREAPKPACQTPLVMVHGLCGGVGLWIHNLDPLCRSRPVVVFDLLGFGRSSRPRFPSDPSQAEQMFVNSIEHWRRAVGLESMILLGHSLGGYLATSYAIQHPERVRHLILVDPWGFEYVPEKQKTAAARHPKWVDLLMSVSSFLNPMAVIRTAGPWGPNLVHKIRPDIKNKFEDLFDDMTMTQYIYHCNAQNPSGEAAFRAMSKSLLWAKRPMLERVHLLPPGLPVTFVFGGSSWMDSGIGEEVAKRRPTRSYTHTVVVKDATHHVYNDQPEEFNRVVQSICDSVLD